MAFFFARKQIPKLARILFKTVSYFYINQIKCHYIYMAFLVFEFLFLFYSFWLENSRGKYQEFPK